MKKLILLFVTLIPSLVFCHPGRTDSSGGHNNRKTGGYHYHNAGKVRSSYNFSNKANKTSKIYSQKMVSSYFLQASLKLLGFYKGKIDGIWGEETIKAIKKFQKDKEVVINGEFDTTTKLLLLESLKSVVIKK
ncbi:MAG: YHYH domain-containing protein [Calditrichaeota bacterium]|nr:MAG: YHYH domain-containing protein [Calditrichota bacterium]